MSARENEKKKVTQLTKQQLTSIYKSLKVQEQKVNRIQKERQEKAKRLYNKKQKVQFVEETADDEVVPVDGDLQAGSKVFMISCSSCHSLEHSSVTFSKGPSLGLIYNRRVGSDENYQSYSENMLSSELFWTGRNLYNFMLNPKILMQYTKCGLMKNSLKSESDRADLIVFLREYSHELGKNLKIKAIKARGYDLYQTEIYTKVQELKNQKGRTDL